MSIKHLKQATLTKGSVCHLLQPRTDRHSPWFILELRNVANMIKLNRVICLQNNQPRVRTSEKGGLIHQSMISEGKVSRDRTWNLRRHALPRTSRFTWLQRRAFHQQCIQYCSVKDIDNVADVCKNELDHTEPTSKHGVLSTTDGDDVQAAVVQAVKEDEHGDISTASNKIISSTIVNYFVEENFIEEFFKEKELNFKTGYTCHYTVCPKLSKISMNRLKENERLYINCTTGYFWCSFCGKRGEWSQLQDNIEWLKTKRATRKTECFRDSPDVYTEDDTIPGDVETELEQADDFTNLSDEECETIMTIFDWHGLKRSVLQGYGLKWSKVDGVYRILLPTLSCDGVVKSVTVMSGSMSEDGDVKILPAVTYPKSRKNNSIHLFGWHPKFFQKRLRRNELVITSSEVNAMTIYQTTNTLALALKNVTHLPQEILPLLEGFDKITLWLGTDMASWNSTKVFAKKLNDKRCCIFRPNAVKFLPLEALQSGENLVKILASASHLSHNAILRFDSLRHEVYAEFADYQQVAGTQWMRYKKLNEILKGHRRGELTVLTGPTGSGKTTFVSDYALDLCMQGVSTLWGSFEISNVRLLKMMLQQYAGKNLRKHLDEFDEVADGFSELPMYFMKYFGQESLDRVLEAMAHAVYIHDIAHIIVDNLQFMIGMDFTDMNRFIKQDRVVAAFRQFATEKNCHVTLIIHPRKVNEGEELSAASIFGSAKVTQEADNIFLIQDQRLTKLRGRKYLQIAKNRFDGDLGVMVLAFNKDTLGFSMTDQKHTRKKPDIHEADDEERHETIADGHDT